MLCGDMLFSGHTLAMVTCALTITYYLPSQWRILHWIPDSCAAIGMVCMIISRTHYTIDVFIAYWLSNFIFRVYHAFCEMEIPVERRNSVLYELWMLWIVEWLESDIVPGR
ncbi:Phosphatidylcholine:ceramide cholinephosphotransferase 3 [Trichostrongylus colubriformis]|uniref:Phosphatidylcholine:ceramide cholinephosphotransferase 3 n=1 Tax=Trichostrongylus colubriformis TaxID=6319 RepID=A0AAN8IP77_TRICO